MAPYWEFMLEEDDLKVMKKREYLQLSVCLQKKSHFSLFVKKGPWSMVIFGFIFANSFLTLKGAAIKLKCVKIICSQWHFDSIFKLSTRCPGSKCQKVNSLMINLTKIYDVLSTIEILKIILTYHKISLLSDTFTLDTLYSEVVDFSVDCSCRHCPTYR